jgi:ribosomal-protein-serine acetyltransferase
MLSHTLRDGVELRLLEERHAEAFYAHVEASRAHLGTWLEEFEGMQSVDDARGFIRGGLDAFAKGTGLTLGIWVDGQLAGGIGLGNVQAETRSAMIGYWLGAPYLGRGLVTDAVRALLDYAFGERALHRVDVTCPALNTPSRHIPERLGFREEGTRRQAIWVHGQPHDEVIYGLLAPEWTAARRGADGPAR